MYRKARIFLVLFFLAGAAGFFYLYFNKPAPKISRPATPPPPKTYWEFNYKDNEVMPAFLCKANTLYSFECNEAFGQNGIHRLRINQVHFDFHYLFDSFPKNKFATMFPEDTRVQIFAHESGNFWKKGWVKVWQEEKPGFPIVLYLNQKEYHPYRLQVKKGQRLDIKRQGFPYFVGHFQNGRFAYETLVTDIRYDRYFWFWDDFDVRFKAAENQFLLVPEARASNCSLKVNYQDYSEAILLKPGQSFDSKIWLEKDNTFSFFNVWDTEDRPSPCKLLDVYTGGKQAAREDSRTHKARESGWLSIKAKSDLFLTHIKIQRNEYDLTLKSGQTKRIKVYQGDVLHSSGGCPYLVDGQLYQDSRLYTHEVYQDGYIEFKGSVVSCNWGRHIEVRFVKRRGY